MTYSTIGDLDFDMRQRQSDKDVERPVALFVAVTSCRQPATLIVAFSFLSLMQGFEFYMIGVLRGRKEGDLWYIRHVGF